MDTAAALLTLDDDTLVSVTATRYNGGGHDVRMEVMGSAGTIGVGYDDSLALRSAESGVDYPKGPQKWSYMERFLPAYRPSWPRSPRWWPAPRAPAPSGTRSRPSASRRRASGHGSKAQLVDLTEIGGGDTTPRNRSLRSRFREDPA